MHPTSAAGLTAHQLDELKGWAGDQAALSFAAATESEVTAPDYWWNLGQEHAIGRVLELLDQIIGDPADTDDEEPDQ